jgi:hypothetical protein
MRVSRKVEFAVVAALIAAVGLFYILTIREGHDWGDDFSMYIQHAKNILAWNDYGNTGYIANPSFTTYSPRSYPPVFPLLLALVYALFGLNLTMMKIEIILMFLGFLFVFFLLFRDELPFRYVAAAIVIIGFNPYFWDFKDQVLSDIPFLFLVYLLFLVVMKVRPKVPQKRQLLLGLLVGLLLYICYGTRNVGVVLLPALVVADLVEFRKPTLFVISAVIIFAVFAAVQSALLRSAESYASLLVISPGIFWANLSRCPQALSLLWQNGYSSFFDKALFAVITAMAIGGYIARIRKKLTLLEIFVPFYVGVIIVWPIWQGLRFLIPIIPLYIFYALVGVQAFSKIEWKKVGNLAYPGLMIAVSLSYASKYSNTNFGPLPEGVGKKESVELFNFISKKTADDDVFVFVKPRALALYTGRRASIYFDSEDDLDLCRLFYGIGVTHVVVSHIPALSAYNLGNSRRLRRFVEEYTANFEPVFANTDFTVYKLKGVLHPHWK